jgi:hypothetical protein
MWFGVLNSKKAISVTIRIAPGHIINHCRLPAQNKDCDFEYPPKYQVRPILLQMFNQQLFKIIQ